METSQEASAIQAKLTAEEAQLFTAAAEAAAAHQRWKGQGDSRPALQRGQSFKRKRAAGGGTGENSGAHANGGGR